MLPTIYYPLPTHTRHLVFLGIAAVFSTIFATFHTNIMKAKKHTEKALAQLKCSMLSSDQYKFMDNIFYLLKEKSKEILTNSS